MIDPLVRVGSAARDILRRQYGAGVDLGEIRLIKDETRAIVARAAVLGEQAPARSVIIKAIRDDPATGFSEWATLAFLSELPDARGLAPTFLGGAADQRVFLMEDFGPGHTLHAILEGDSAQRAERALLGLATQNARLHAVTLHHEQDWLRQRDILPAAEQVGRRHEATRWLESSARIDAWFTAVGCSAPLDFPSSLAQIAEVYANPGAWLSLTHGDPAPSNNHIAHDAVRLLDFEYGLFRHALYDITAWNILCPLPRRAVQLMRSAFQAELAATLPAARDSAAFETAWATLCAYRGLALLTWVSPDILTSDRSMVGAWSAREAVLAAVARTAEAVAGAPGLEPVARAASQLYKALDSRWPHLGGSKLATRWPALQGIE